MQKFTNKNNKKYVEKLSMKTLFVKAREILKRSTHNFLMRDFRLRKLIWRRSICILRKKIRHINMCSNFHDCRHFKFAFEISIYRINVFYFNNFSNNLFCVCVSTIFQYSFMLLLFLFFSNFSNNLLCICVFTIVFVDLIIFLIICFVYMFLQLILLF
jgi:cellulose synthase/poly-beta-1,6-N-acetylglucosamine synthase-like glycosyltransferase